MAKQESLPLRPGKLYTVTFGFGPGDNFHDSDAPWIRGEFTAKFRRLLRPVKGEWLVLYFDNGILLEGNAWHAVEAG